MRTFSLAILLLGIFAWLQGQTRVVYGELTAFNKYPVRNIKVSARKSDASVRSDSLGRFAIVVEDKDVIRIQPKAFKPVRRRVGEDTDTLEINLVFIDTPKNRKLATGYGYIDQEDLSHAVSHMQQENNEFCNYTNVFDLIKGRFPGVTVTRTATGGAVYIRGQTSINMSSEALYVVDGGITSHIEWIHPCDIRSIDILKDSMAAIYGSRGANGVVVIQTKKGID